MKYLSQKLQDDSEKEGSFNPDWIVNNLLCVQHTYALSVQSSTVMLLAMKTRNQWLVLFDPSIVTVKQSSIVNNNSPIQDYVHPDDQTQPFEITPGFKPFIALQMCCVQMCCKSRRSISIEIDIGNQSI